MFYYTRVRQTERRKAFSSIVHTAPTYSTRNKDCLVDSFRRRLMWVVTAHKSASLQSMFHLPLTFYAWLRYPATTWGDPPVPHRWQQLGFYAAGAWLPTARKANERALRHIRICLIRLRRPRFAALWRVYCTRTAVVGLARRTCTPVYAIIDWSRRNGLHRSALPAFVAADGNSRAYTF